MKPTLVFQTGTTKSTKPKDVVTGKNFKVNRSQSQQNRQPVSYESNHDDALAVNESGYDVNIKNYGITSSQPVILGVFPLHNAVDEEEVINIQRNLNLQTLTSVSKIISSVTGSFTPVEAASVQNIKQPQFDEIVGKVTNAYRAKANYLSALIDYLDVQVTDGIAWDIDIADIQNENQRVFIKPISAKIGNYAETRDWTADKLRMQSDSGRFNIAKMLQTLKNAYGILRYDAIGSIIPVEDDTFSIKGLRPWSQYTDSLGIIQEIYGRSPYAITNNFDSVADASFAILDRDLTLAKVFDQNIREVVSLLIGDLSQLERTQNLSSNTNVGVFRNLVSINDSGRRVLTLDNILSGQDALNTYEVADQYYLMQPLTSNKELLISRSSQFDAYNTQIQSSISSFTDTLLKTNNASMLKAFLSLISGFIEGSALSKGADTSQDANSALRIAVLMKSYEDNDLLLKIFKILMLRDRIRNSNDYTTVDVEIFVSRSRELLKEYVNDLSRSYFGFYKEDGITKGKDQEAIVDTLNGVKIGRDADNISVSSRPWGKETSDVDNVFSDLYEDLIDDTRGMLWDRFYDAARSIETYGINFTNFGTQMLNNDPFTLRAAGITQFIESYRDNRAFAFMLKTLTFLKRSVSGNRFDMYSSAGTINRYDSGMDRSNSLNSIEWRVSIDTVYFNRLNTVIKVFGNNTFKLDKNLERKTTTWNNTTSFEDVLTEFFDISGFMVPAIINTLQPFQTMYDAFTYAGTFLNNVNNLLKTASDTAYKYTPSYGESLASLYTANTVTELNHLSKRGFQASDDLQDYTSLFVREQTYLQGMLAQALRTLPREEDSFIVLCAIPYGLLERIGSFALSKERDINVTLTFRNIDLEMSDAFEVTKTFPAASFIDPVIQQYSINDVASSDKILAATRLYYLNARGIITADTFTDDIIKMNEIDSTSFIEYLRILYGLDFDLMSFHQNPSVDATSLFPGLDTASQKLSNEIVALGFNDLITSRYVAASQNYTGIRQKKIFENGLQGFNFDKIVAFAISGSSLNTNGNYICDIIASVTLNTSEDIVLATTQDVVEGLASKSSRVSNMATKILEKSQPRLGNR